MCIYNFWSLIPLASAVVLNRNLIQSDLATGRNVLEAASVVEICAKHLYNVPQPPSTHKTTPLPADLWKIIMDCLTKERDRVVYDVAVDSPEAVDNVLARASHLSNMTGADPLEGSIVLVLHGDEVAFFAKDE